MEEGVDEFSRVPVECIERVIWPTSPRDACRLSVVSAAFRSAAASDAVWQRFLPPDFPSILSRAAAADDLGCSSSSKKDLFFRLCHHPLLLHAPTPMSFWLDKSSGAKCYMLLARALSIASGDTREYWVWNRISDARFGEVALLLDVCLLDIVGRIGSSALSPKTAYAAYLVFKLAHKWHGLHCPTRVTLGCVTLGGVELKHAVCPQPVAGAQKVMRRRLLLDKIGRRMSQETMDAGVISPQGRSDGWMEVEMGEFYNETGEDGEVEMSLRETSVGWMEVIEGHWKKGLIVQGIEIRPKIRMQTERIRRRREPRPAIRPKFVTD